MSGTSQSGRRPATLNVIDFGATTGQSAAPTSALEPPQLSDKAAGHWESVLAQASEYGLVKSGDRDGLAKICEQLVTMDFVRRAKSQKRFNPLTDRGLRVARLERQTTKEIERLWKSVRKDIESRANARPMRGAAAVGGGTPSIRDFAQQLRGPS